LIVLSHEKAFLCRIWERTDRTSRSAIEIHRDAAGSNLRQWDVAADSVTDHDRRDAELRDFLSQGAPDLRVVATDLRPHLEAYMRVVAPRVFRPGMLLGGLIAICRDRVGTPDEVLNTAQTTELEQLVDYANRFHHDTNPAFATAPVTDGELRGMVRRVLAFTGPG
jgi:hypothetical protein